MSNFQLIKKNPTGGETTSTLVEASDSGYGLHFDGTTTGTYIDAGDSTILDGATKITLECIAETSTAATQVLIAKDWIARCFRLRFNSDGTLQFNVANGSTNATATSSGVYNDGKPRHICGVWDNAALSIYVNGNLDGTATLAGGAIPNTADWLSLGSLSDGGSNRGNWNVLNGTLYRARLWNKALTAAEVTASYENATVPFADQWGKEVYTSDFSSNVDGWGGFSATSSGNNDSISDGTTSKNDCLKTYAQAASSTHGITQTFGTLLAGTVTVKLDYLIPGPSFPGTGGGNTKVDGFKVENTTTSTVVRTESTLDVWTSIEFTATSAGGDAFKIFMLDGAADSFAGANDANDDRIFFKNIEINNRGCVSDYDCAFSNPSVSRTIQDRAGAADGTSSASGVTQVTKIEAVNTNKLNVGGTVPRVGIGLDAGDAPSVPLHIKNAGGSYDEAIIALESGNNGITEIQMGDVSDIDIGNIKYSNINNSMSFTTNAATALTIDSDGNVHIGSATYAGGKLMVSNDDDTVYDASAASHQRDEGSTFMVNNESTTTNSFSQLVLRNRDSSVGGCRIVSVNTGADASDLAFVTGDTGEKMRIDSSGNVTTNGGLLSVTANHVQLNNGYALRWESSGTSITGSSSAVTVAGNMTVNNSSNMGLVKGSADNLSLADDATIQVSDAIAGAMLLHIYEVNDGYGGLIFATYNGAPVVLADPANVFSNADTDAKICVTKSATSHDVYIKNRLGATKNFRVLTTAGNIS